MIEQAKFTCSPSGKASEIQTKMIDYQDKTQIKWQIKYLSMKDLLNLIIYKKELILII